MNHENSLDSCLSLKESLSELVSESHSSFDKF